MNTFRHLFPTWEDSIKSATPSIDINLRRRMAVENGFFGWVRTR